MAGYNVSTTENDKSGDGVFYIGNGGNLTIKGEGTINGVGGNDYNIAIWADGGKVTIEGGTYTNVGATDSTGDTHFDLIYVKNGGEVVINGGKFIAENPEWTLNSHDKLAGTIKVYGGEFVGFNPMNNTTEGPETNWMADDLHAADIDGDNVYTVHEAEYEAVVTDPTCTEDGYTTYTCYCGDEYVADEVAALGHTAGEWVVVTPATCVDNGLKTQSCTVCGEVLASEEIVATGHTYEAVVTAPTFEADGFTTYTCACGDSYVVIDEGSKLIAVAEVNGVKYETLAEAMAQGGEVTLLANV